MAADQIKYELNVNKVPSEQSETRLLNVQNDLDSLGGACTPIILRNTSEADVPLGDPARCNFLAFEVTYQEDVPTENIEKGDPATVELQFNGAGTWFRVTSGHMHVYPGTLSGGVKVRRGLETQVIRVTTANGNTAS